MCNRPQAHCGCNNWRFYEGFHQVTRFAHRLSAIFPWVSISEEVVERECLLPLEEVVDAYQVKEELEARVKLTPLTLWHYQPPPSKSTGP